MPKCPEMEIECSDYGPHPGTGIMVCKSMGNCPALVAAETRRYRLPDLVRFQRRARPRRNPKTKYLNN